MFVTRRQRGIVAPSAKPIQVRSEHALVAGNIVENLAVFLHLPRREFAERSRIRVKGESLDDDFPFLLKNDYFKQKSNLNRCFGIHFLHFRSEPVRSVRYDRKMSSVWCYERACQAKFIPTNRFFLTLTDKTALSFSAWKGHALIT